MKKHSQIKYIHRIFAGITNDNDNIEPYLDDDAYTFSR